MYLEFFGLNAYPFQVAPDAKYLYFSKAHTRAKAYLDYGIWSPDGFVVITGDVGSGKTILIKKLLSELPRGVVVAKIFQTQLNETEFLQAVLVEFGFQPFNAAKVELLTMLNTFLMNQHLHKRPVVLIVDEAQNLSERVLEELRLLSGLETENEKILHVLLVGQRELAEKLHSPGLEQLAQRVQLRFHLKPLSLTETSDYIEHRLRIASARNPRLFSHDTIPIIYHYTHGVPRLINMLCDTTLTAAFVDTNPVISVDVINAAAAELQWAPRTAQASAVRQTEKSAASDNPRDTSHPSTSNRLSANGKDLEEKVNRLYDFIPKFATSVTTRIKSIDVQMKKLSDLLRDRR